MGFDITASLPAFTWVMDRGQVLSFYPRTAGTLRVVCGRIWATLRSPLDAAEQEDLFVTPQAPLALGAGQALVIESWPEGGGLQTTLVWEAAALVALAA